MRRGRTGKNLTDYLGEDSRYGWRKAVYGRRKAVETLRGRELIQAPGTWRMEDLRHHDHCTQASGRKKKWAEDPRYCTCVEFLFGMIVDHCQW